MVRLTDLHEVEANHMRKRAEEMQPVALVLGSIADHGDVIQPPTADVDWKFDMPLLERHMADELRTFYHEAIAAQPDPGAPNHAALNDWIFSGTALEHGSRSQLT